MTSPAASSPPAHDLNGTWSVQVDFVAGPMRGQSHPREYSLQPEGLFVQLPPAAGIGRWSIDGDQLTWSFHETIADPDGTPTAVVQITAQATVAPEGHTFAGTATGTVYGIKGGLLAVNQTAMHAVRA